MSLRCVRCGAEAQWSWAKEMWMHKVELQAPYPHLGHRAQIHREKTPDQEAQERMDRERIQNFGRPCFACGGPEPFVTCKNHEDVREPA